MTNQAAPGSGRRIAIKILVNGAGLYVASLVAKPGVEFLGTGSGLVLTALLTSLLFGLVNTFARPVLKFFSTGVPLLVEGLFTFAVNALSLWLISKISAHFHIQDVWYALIGAVIATTVALILHAVLPDDKKGVEATAESPGAGPTTMTEEQGR